MKNTNSTTMQAAMKAIKNEQAAAEQSTVEEMLAMIENSFLPAGKLDEILQVEKTWTDAIEAQKLVYKAAVGAKEAAYDNFNKAKGELKDLQLELNSFKHEWELLAATLSNRESELRGLIEISIAKATGTERYKQMVKVAEATPHGTAELERVTREQVTIAVGELRKDLVASIRELKESAEIARVRWVEADAALMAPGFIPAVEAQVGLFKAEFEEKKRLFKIEQDKLQHMFTEAEAAKAEALK